MGTNTNKISAEGDHTSPVADIDSAGWNGSRALHMVRI